MLRLFRFILTLGAMAVVIYFAVTVPLGSKTLWGHLQAIAGTEESKDLVEGVKAKAGEVLHRAEAPDGSGAEALDGGDAAGDDLEAEDREQLRKLIRKQVEAEKKEAAPPEPPPLPGQ